MWQFLYEMTDKISKLFLEEWYQMIQKSTLIIITRKGFAVDTKKT